MNNELDDRPAQAVTDAIIVNDALDLAPDWMRATSRPAQSWVVTLALAQ